MPSLRRIRNKQYYINKSRIDKSRNRNTAYKIQFYNNTKVDELVNNYDNPNYVIPNTSMLWADIAVLNKPSVYENYNRLINSPYIKNDSIQELLIRNKANKELNRIVETEINQIVENLNYAEKLIKKVGDIKEKYNTLLKEQEVNSITNRRKLLTEAAGGDIRTVLNYRQLDFLTERLHRENQMSSQHEMITEINRLSQEAGDGVKYPNKQWVWTGEGQTTRHESNNMQRRKIEDNFLIVNDKTLDIDEIQYPCDPSGSPSNCWICYCECDYF